MLKNISIFSTNFLIQKRPLLAQKRNIYTYGFEIIYSTLFCTLSILLLGAIQDRLLQTFIFLSVIYVQYFIPFNKRSNLFFRKENKARSISYAPQAPDNISGSLIHNNTYLLDKNILFDFCRNKQHNLFRYDFIFYKRKGEKIMINFFLIFFSIIVFYRYFKYLSSTKQSGNFIFFSALDKKTKLLGILSLCLYFISILLYYKFKLFNFLFSYIDIALIFTWIIQIFLPCKIYENGIKTPYRYIPWRNVILIESCDNQHITLHLKQNTLQNKVNLCLKKGDSLPVSINNLKQTMK